MAIALTMTGLLTTTGCTGVAAWMGGEDVCTTKELSPSIRARYSLPELPPATEVHFCEGEDKDGDWARLTFRSAPDEAQSYLRSLGIENFAEIPAEKVDSLAQPDRNAWRLTKGLSYKKSGKSIEYNGYGLVDYIAFIEDTPHWDGRVYLGMYCAV
ncbi:hypothetical protein AB0N09_38515 [Streptomyces erythrochromogenes]|uniref:hypothetical protein n=1 Tax=Streptomyces erythrochromogenes TaxID=285574 RepID=UPI003442CA19